MCWFCCCLALQGLLREKEALLNRVGNLEATLTSSEQQMVAVANDVKNREYLLEQRTKMLEEHLALAANEVENRNREAALNQVSDLIPSHPSIHQKARRSNTHSSSRPCPCRDSSKEMAN